MGPSEQAFYRLNLGGGGGGGQNSPKVKKKKKDVMYIVQSVVSWHCKMTSVFCV